MLSSKQSASAFVMLKALKESALVHVSQVLTLPGACIASLLPVLQQIRRCNSPTPQQQQQQQTQVAAILVVEERIQEPQRLLQCSKYVMSSSRCSGMAGFEQQHKSEPSPVKTWQHGLSRASMPSNTICSISAADPAAGHGHELDLVQHIPERHDQLLQQQQRERFAKCSSSIGVPASAAGGPTHIIQHQHQQQQPGSAVSQQVPDGPGPPCSPARAPHLAARHQLKEYLASIDSVEFVDQLAEGVWAGNRLAVSRSLTLCESSRPDHALQAAALLRRLIDNDKQLQGLQRVGKQQHPGVQPVAFLARKGNSSSSSVRHQEQQPAGAPPLRSQPTSDEVVHGATAVSRSLSAQGRCVGGSLRVGLSGPPGAGKSSLIETWGCYLADHGSKVAVLAVDPSSAETGGAILGDKTRMARLSSHPNAFVRPSPARGTLGGISRSTYDAMVICEAAGYDKVLVETVGVGQSEVAVADLVDCMVLVMPPLGGDDLQMIKRGIMEVADVLLVNKADGPTEAAATRAAAEYAGCLRLMPHRYQGWQPQVLPVSAHSGKGVPALARLVADFNQALMRSGELEKCRVRRAEAITWLNLEEQLLSGLRHDPHVRWLMTRLMPAVRAGQMAPRSAADIALSYFYQHCS